ncbi:MAG: hypothetical protein JST89_13530 [Cyanobacteria bacterium SZAS-4]|nr:hypothetical protein [Cyanobacteria bacterium SZAS-4]
MTEKNDLIDAVRLKANSGAESRDSLVQFLKRELLGPDPFWPAVQLNGEEILPFDNSPRRRYSCGVLFAQKSTNSALDKGNDDSDMHQSDNADGSDDDNSAFSESKKEDNDEHSEAPPETDIELSLSNEYLPSAMGISALVNISAPLKVSVQCATYHCGPLGKNLKTGATKEGWFRYPHLIVETFLPSELLGDSVVVVNRVLKEQDAESDLELKLHLVSRPYSNTERLITFSLLNTNVSERESIRDEQCFFQCRMTIENLDGSACFLNYPTKPPEVTDEDACSMHLLYAHRGVYAVGHGCAADWQVDSSSQSATSISTESIPEFEVKPIVPRELNNIDLSMKKLWQGARSEIIDNCTALANEYQEWIDLEAKKSFPTGTIEQITAVKHMEQCRNCLHRIKKGIDFLRNDELVLNAFRFMNRAMLMQQEHYKISSEHSRTWVLPEKSRLPQLEKSFSPPNYNESTAKWRPFQLAFVLMNIESMHSPECRERELVDIIWFPTGGGKTEAYLGLTAFTFFLRRLKNRDDLGTIAIMRYTLRLLTAQQFQRAASLVCASEIIRKENQQALGSERFSIGLWVGSEVTPNNGKKAVACLKDLESGQGQNKFVLMVCPWCGCQFGPIKLQRGSAIVKGYFRETDSRVKFVCEDSACPFSKREGLPVSVIDEELYTEPPSLLIGTVDKFAMMPWIPESGVFFGHTIDGDNRKPPDLIIQDELHLISGPLGSMVGLYESMIDALTVCNSVVKHKTKIIASTATIARSREQVQALYARSSALFPPQGTKAGESFFAKEDSAARGRLYLGVFNSALNSHVSSQVRVYAALLQGCRLLHGPSENIDPYWTLMSYYNSLRELGLGVTLLDADVAEYIRFICGRYCIQKSYIDEPFRLQRSVRHHEELTGRVHSSELPEKLQLLFRKFTGDQPYPIDVCMATNMIQVGLDVQRLSLMQIVGQPKTTSEYIQASSRVGRSSTGPGLVVANLNPAKPRDRSHFEQFKQYHQNLYKFVEPTSVTPFAYPVRERALHAIAVGLIRQWGQGSLKDRPIPDLPQDLQTRIATEIVERVRHIDLEEASDTEQMLNQFFQRWRYAAAAEYGGFGPPVPEPVPLMFQAGTEPDPSWNNRSFETPTSMRAVDATCEAAALQGVFPTRDSAQKDKEQ